MAEKIFEDIDFDFDVRNNRLLTPYMFLSESSLLHFTDNSFSNCYTKDSSHLPYLYNILHHLENDIFAEKYYGDDKEKMEMDIQSVINTLKDSLDIENQDPSIEQQFYHPYDIIQDQIYAMKSFIRNLKKIFKRDFRQMPISTARFPHFHQKTINYFFYDNEDTISNEENLSQKDEGKLDEMIQNFEVNDKAEIPIPFEKLDQFNTMLSKHTKAFSLSPSFSLSSLSKLNSILDVLLFKETSENIKYNDFSYFNQLRNLSPDNFNDEQKALRIKYFQLIMLIKMHLYFNIQKFHECLTILLIFIIMEQDNFKNETENCLSFKNSFQNSLPDTKQRSQIINNYTSDQILDFFFSPKGNNDFILTKDGVFKITESSSTRVDFPEDEKSKIQEILAKSDKTNVKLAFSNGILYLLLNEDKKIHKILISQDEITEEKEGKKDNISEKWVNQKRINEEEEDKKSKGKHKNKKLREKAKKEKKIQRKNERKIKDKIDVNLESIPVNIPNYPIVSMGAYDNYVRILQRKNYSSQKTTFILTNVDLTPNSRTNFDVFEAFEKFDNENKIDQKQIEFEIEDKNGKYKINEICFTKDLIFFSFEDSSFEQWMIYNNGQIERFKHSLSPYIVFPYSRLKMDNNSFLYVLEPIEQHENESVCINKMYLKEINYYIRSESGIFIKYPFLKKFSDIVDNCSQFIINREVTKELKTDDYYKAKNRDDDDDDKKKKKKQIVEKVDPFLFNVSPEEMSCIIQSLSSIVDQFEPIESLIKELKDEKLKQFFIITLLKMYGINLLYGTSSYYTTKDKITETTINRFNKFKKFIKDLLALIKQPNSNNYEIMLRESIIFALTLSGKFMFLPNCIEELHEIMDKFFYQNEINNEFSKIILRSLSSFIFQYPSALYIVDNSFYSLLIEFEQDLNIQNFFLKSILFIVLEKRFAKKIMDEEFIQFITPYIQSLFEYIHHLLSKESIPLIEIEQLFSYFFGIKVENCFLSLILEKEFIKIAPILYDVIRKVPEVIESDQEYRKRSQDVYPQKVHKEIKVIESEHPYNLSLPPDPIPINRKRRQYKCSEYIEQDLGHIVFEDADVIYCIFDNRCQLSNDTLKILCPSDKYGEKTYNEQSDFSFNQAECFRGNKINIKIKRSTESSNEPCWGYKMTFIGVKFDSSFYWIPNLHLNFYNHFIAYLANLYDCAHCSTSYTKNEKEFSIILKAKIIQGIKFEEIDNYESNLNKSQNDGNNNSNKTLKRKLTRGISRGISYDTENDSIFDDNFKKSFLTDIITVKEDSKTRGKLLLDILYTKTAKQTRIRLNDSTKSILENEHYLAACLFKQLGLISLCLKFVNDVMMKTGFNDDNNNNKYDHIEIPSSIRSLWKMIYTLRQTLFFSYQKSKTALKPQSNQNNNSFKLNFKQYSEEIKRKCILLLYSDPILKFKEKGNLDSKTIESTAKSIFSFVTSEIPLSNISELIDIRRKRLSITSQSMFAMKTFIEGNLLFDSSKYLFIRYYEYFPSMNKFEGVTQKELDELNKLYGSLSYDVIKYIYTDPTISMIFNHDFIKDSLFNHNDEESVLKSSKIFINLLEKNKNSTNFAHDYTNFLMISTLLAIAATTKNNEITDYVISLLDSDQIDSQSKRIILTVIPSFIQLLPENKKVADKELAFSILSKNSNLPIIVRSIFFWFASIINLDNEGSNDDTYKVFILKVLKGIGQSFAGESCLFIDDSFQPFAHRSVAEGMISFIRLLINNKNRVVLEIIHDILTNKINNIKFDDSSSNDDLIITLGLFASIGQTLSAMEPERKYVSDQRKGIVETIIGFNTSNNKLRIYDKYNRKFHGAYLNIVLFDPKKLDLNATEVENLLYLHELISKSKYFTDKPNYEININQREISESMLISTFYSFLPVIMQNINNVNILMSNENLRRSLSLFEFSTNPLPSNENSIIILSHYLEQAITSPLYKEQPKINFVDHRNSFRFMKMNFGEVVYNDQNDLIKTDINHRNVFICTRPFDSDMETYYELKINKIGDKQIFIGFIDSNKYKINKAFGFGSVGHSKVFCRKARYLASELDYVGDKIMKKEQTESNAFVIKEGDKIGCYYTSDYTYLTLNENITKYRLTNMSLDSYVPIIIVDHDEVELEIVQNVTIVDSSKDEFSSLNVDKLPPNYFDEKDIIKVIVSKDRSGNDGQFKEKDHLIGQQIYIAKTIVNEKKSKLETIDAFPRELLRYRENYGIIKDMEPLNDSRFVNKLKLETYNNNTLSKEIIDHGIDSRFVKGIKTNFFNLIENRSNTKLGINGIFNMKFLPQKLRFGSDFNSISNYLRAKTIKDNSKSISIIMTRYLVFVLLDYLRYSKSSLLQNAESEEMKKIIQALSISLPTITTFRPRFLYSIENDDIAKWSIFPDKNEDDDEKSDDENSKKYLYILPGFSKMFNYSFLLFLKQSEKTVSPQIISKLLLALIDKALIDNSTVSSLYQLISSDEKIESTHPLPEKCEFIKELEHNKMEQRRIIGFIPLLLTPIPDILPSVKCRKRRLRNSSDETSYFNFVAYDSIEMKWKFDTKKIQEFKFNQKKTLDFDHYKDFKLKFGVLLLPKDLPENLLNSPLGFIQITFTIFQAMNDTEFLYDKLRDFMSNEFMEKLFSLALKKSPLLYPFIQVIIVTLISKYGFKDSLFYNNANNASFIFGDSTKKLFKMEDFPSGQNELPLLFSIYSNLSQTRITELSTNKESIGSLFDEYESINKELMKISDTEISKKEKKFTECEIRDNDSVFSWRRRRGRTRRRWTSHEGDSDENTKKNFRSFYLIYYYSCLLHNDDKLPYPMFLFVYEWMMQYFGGFRMAISKKDVDKFKNITIDENKEILYKSNVFQNDNNLSCSYQQTNIFESRDDDSDCDDMDYENNDDDDNEEDKKEKSDEKDNDNDNKKKIKKKKEEAYKVFVHQLSDDKQIELPKSGESVDVSFPLEVLVIHEEGTRNQKNRLKENEMYVLSFTPSEHQQKECFVSNYDQIQSDVKQFKSLSKYDNELFDAIQHSKLSNESNNSKSNHNSHDNDNDNDNNDNNNNFDDSQNNDVSDSDSTDHSHVLENDKEGDADVHAFYSMDKIPKVPTVSIVDLPSTISPHVVALRISVITTYNRIIENMMVSYTLSEEDDNKYLDMNWWKDNSHSDEKPSSLYMKQIIGPAYSMSTKSKFEFINNILKNEQNNRNELELIFNRFEAETFKSNRCQNKSKNGVFARPLFVQFMEQVDDDSISLLKVRGNPPFSVNLVGEGAIDGGGPAREIFSSLIVEMMNECIGIFTYNPNRRHNCKDTNQEDLIPNHSNNNHLLDDFGDEVGRLLSKGLTFCGALIAACIVSSIPQPMKLASMVWEYLTSGIVSIESVYEIDNNFKELIQTAESLEKQDLSSMSDADFKRMFMKTFEIPDSFDKSVELVPSGSKVPVTKENLHEFIQLAKKWRLHEFDEELKEIKEGFDKIMTYKNITTILNPSELKLLVCGEPNCSIEQMKNLINLSAPYNEKIDEDEIKAMFWNVLESFSPEERMQFIKFSTGNLGLPAPGLKWDENMSVDIQSKDEKNKYSFIHSSTCSSYVTIPFFESEEELAKMLRLALNYSGMITDNTEHFDEISADFL